MICLYGSRSGTTRRLAHRAAELLGNVPVKCVAEVHSIEGLAAEDRLVMFCPTYGDGEFEEGFESFLLRTDWRRLRGCRYAFCEVGIYTGYEDFGYGLAMMLHRTLDDAGLIAMAPSLAVDAVPIADWKLIERWVRSIRTGRWDGR